MPRTRSLLLAALAASLCPTPVVGQTAEVTYYGATRCSGSPLFAVTGLPRLGSQIQIMTEGSVYYPTGGSQISLLFGLSDKAAGSLQLPFGLQYLNFRWCGLLLNSNEVWLPVRAQNPYVQVPFTVPNDPNLLGAQVHVQALRRRYGIGPGPELFLSLGVRLTVGR